MGLFDKILAQAAEADREILNKYPELKASVEKAEQLEQEVEKQAATMADWNERLSGWERWKQSHWDDARNVTREHVATLQELEEARRQMAELQAKGEVGDMTFEEILAGLATKGFLTKEQMEAELAKRKVADLETVDRRLDQMDRGMSTVFSKAAPLLLRHDKEFGKELDFDGLFKYMADNQIHDPQVAYDRMVEPDRRARQQEAEAARLKEIEDMKAAHAAELERVKAEAAEQAKVAYGTPASPVESNVGAAGIRLTRPTLTPTPDGPAIPEKAELGRGEVAAAIANHYLASKGLPVN